MIFKMAYWKKSVILLATIMVAIGGCMAKVTVDKRPNLALPIYDANGKTQEWVIVD